MKVIDINPRDILLDEKKYENNLIYYISYKTFTGSIPLRIRFAEIDAFIKIYVRIRYLVFFDGEFYDEIFDWITYLISEKSIITDSINHHFARIRINSYNSLPIEKYWLLIML